MKTGVDLANRLRKAVRLGRSATLLATSTIVASCATTPPGKPLLTAAATRRIAASCGAQAGKFHRQRSDLPYATFITKASDVAPDDGPTPTLRCIDQALKPYRYAFFGSRPEGQPTPS